MVRNGYLPEREILTGVGQVAAKVPKVCSCTGEPVVFRPSLVPPYVRKARRVESALPWLYLKGIATGQMQEALEVLVDPEAKRLSASVISRLKKEWEAEYASGATGVTTDGKCLQNTDLRCPPDQGGASLDLSKTRGGTDAQPRGLAHDTRDARERLLPA